MSQCRSALTYHKKQYCGFVTFWYGPGKIKIHNEVTKQYYFCLMEGSGVVPVDNGSGSRAGILNKLWGLGTE